jgi:hypothetical protein
MKNLIALAGLFACSCISQSNLVRDSDGYALLMDNYSYEADAGTSKEIMLSVLRSRAYVEKPIRIKVISPLPKGITIAVDPNPILADQAIIIVSASDIAERGVFNVIISGDNAIPAMPSKGIVLKISIN